MELVEDDQGSDDARRVDIVQPVGQAVGPAEEPAEHLVVCRHDDPATVEESVIRLLTRLERHERALCLATSRVHASGD